MAGIDFTILSPMINRYITELNLRVSPRLNEIERAVQVMRHVSPEMSTEEIECALTLVCLQVMSESCCGEQNHKHHTDNRQPHQMHLRSHNQKHMVLRNGRSIKHES